MRPRIRHERDPDAGRPIAPATVWSPHSETVGVGAKMPGANERRASPAFVTMVRRLLLHAYTGHGARVAALLGDR